MMFTCYRDDLYLYLRLLTKFRSAHLSIWRYITVMPPLHDDIKPLAWLLGKWKAVQANAFYPTMKDFSYGEEIEFFHVGQPNIQFTLYSFNRETLAPMHREVGFLKIKPGTNTVAFISAHNLGLADIEEGEVQGEELNLGTTSLGRLSFGKDPAVLKLKRRLRKSGEFLEQVVDMETSKTPLTQHLLTRYEKVA
jgi:THAP domain-containing protein 4